ncbi:hypothetical protein [Bdellovibrio sp.]|uniref:hypothetical protein n=1 Tax=Bdellovibrio sp. TaxID=28201 RepID=UPI0039E23025
MQYGVVQKLIALICILACASCTTMSKTARVPEACHRGMELSFDKPWLYWLVGVTTQQGYCAIFPELSFETGFYYYTYRDKLDYAVSVDGGVPDSGASAGMLYSLATMYGCYGDARDLFYQRLSEKKLEIFGENLTNHSRTIMVNIDSLILNDPNLRKSCLRYNGWSRFW